MDDQSSDRGEPGRLPAHLAMLAMRPRGAQSRVSETESYQSLSESQFSMPHKVEERTSDGVSSINKIKAQWASEAGGSTTPRRALTPRRTSSPLRPHASGMPALPTASLGMSTPRQMDASGYPSKALSDAGGKAPSKRSGTTPPPKRSGSLEERNSGDYRELYRELENLQLQLVREKTIAQQAIDDKKQAIAEKKAAEEGHRSDIAAIEDAHRREVAMIKQALQDALAENERLELLAKAYESQSQRGR
eukprot:gnl/TRDRNA2_/TRDRNA2_53618_c0_seq1.p1 gnl/TRDRNA2_/TRDRNA2_53618_c0~~gnl/TRDRNA2_/TRDRNA2_53618_c0_seq1.p1  ORF type:complete len:248 (-),score=46.42 gnl/TRDRNA2_/TRDRNA2_53618_c0_seq1:298-1041(-)